MAKREKVDGIPTIAMPHIEKLTVVRGAAGCGKTQGLIEAVRSLLAQGTPPSSILVLCATPDAAHTFSNRLGAENVRIASTRELALELLSQPAAIALFGHGPRILMPFEEDILFEDLKMSGIEIDRLAGMFSFFKRSMTEISDDHPDFLMDDDERTVMSTLHDNLQLRGAFLEQQISANAARYLAMAEDAAHYAHVFVDDWQYLSRASQVMAELLAHSSLYVAINSTATSEPMLESYPYARGAEELLRANPQARIVDLDKFQGPRAIGLALNAVRLEAGLEPCLIEESSDAPQEAGSVAIKVLPNADCEIETTADLVASAIKDGTSPEAIYITSPNGTWTSRIAHALKQRDIGSYIACQWTDLAESNIDTSNDARYLKILTAILLAGSPDDDTAWRSWCAFDEPLAASGEIALIAQAAIKNGLRLHEILASNKPGVMSERMVHSYRMGISLLGRTNGMTRDHLLRTLTNELYGPSEPIPPMVLRLCSGANPDDTAEALRERILNKMSCNLGWESDDADGSEQGVSVRIGKMNRMCGLSAQLIIFTGFVNGFFPQHGFFNQTITPPGDIDNARAAYARKLCCALGKATKTAIFTSFTKIPCSQAEQLGIKIDRIGLENRTRMARVSPSIFCDCLDGCITG